MNWINAVLYFTCRFFLNAQKKCSRAKTFRLVEGLTWHLTNPVQKVLKILLRFWKQNFIIVKKSSYKTFVCVDEVSTKSVRNLLLNKNSCFNIDELFFKNTVINANHKKAIQSFLQTGYSLWQGMHQCLFKGRWKEVNL